MGKDIYAKYFLDYRDGKIIFKDFSEFVSPILNIVDDGSELMSIENRDVQSHYDIVLDETHLINILLKFISGSMTVEDVVAWANVMIALDYYNLNPIKIRRKIITTILHAIANSKINSTLTVLLANHYLDCLQKDIFPK